MPDFSVGNSFNPKPPKRADSHISEFTKAEREYIDFKIKVQKTDFANSSSAINSEKELLAKMKEAAKKEGLEDKLAEIEEREKELNKLKKPSSVDFAPYYKPIGFSGKEKTNSNQEATLQKISAVFTNASEEQVEYLINKLTAEEAGAISDSVAKAMLRLGELGCHPNSALFFFEKFAKESDDKKSPKSIDLAMVDRFKNLKSKGMDDNDIIKVLSLFNKDYADKDILDSAINKFADAKISPERIIDIISAISVRNSKENNLSLSPDTIQNISTLKNALLRTEDVEKREQNNPIAMIDRKEIETKNDIIVFKDGQIAAIYPKTETSKKDYDNFIAEMQDSVMYEFAKEYTNENGEIPFDAMRVVTSLRRSGITMKHILELMNFCYKNGEIESKNLVAVNRIKKAGALSSDILKILSAVNKDDDGNYDTEDITNAQLLTKFRIDGDNTARLIPLVRNNKDTLDLVSYLSTLIEKKSNIVELVKLTRDEKGNVSEQSMEIIANLAENFLDKEQPMSSIDFLLNTQSIINAAKNPKTNLPDDKAAGICSIMCTNKESPENILIGLHICKNQDGEIDSALADILWNMSLDKANINEIEQLIDTCKDDTGAVNHELTKNIISLYEKGMKTQKIMETVLNTG